MANRYPLYEKKAIFLGSSVTYGHASGGYGFPESLRDQCGLEIIKEAVSGTTLVKMPGSYVDRLLTIDTTFPADVFVCQLSTNDATKGLPLGTPDDTAEKTDTVAGAIAFITEYARKTWDCPVVFYTSPRYDSAAYQAMVDLLLAMQPRLGVEIIDLWNDADFNDITPEQREMYMKDPLHPTRAGYEFWWQPAFEKALTAVLKKHRK